MTSQLVAVAAWTPHVREFFGSPRRPAPNTDRRLPNLEALHLLGDLLSDLGRFDEAERALLDADVICRAVRGPRAVPRSEHAQPSAI